MQSPWKQDFPIFLPHAHPHLCYLDSAATCLTPKHVADAMYHYQCYMHANNPKGLYQLTAYLSDLIEQARHKLASFLGAANDNEIVFTRGTTDALNMIAYSYLEPQLIKAKQQEEPSNIVISAAEHEANILPWQRLAKAYGAELRVIPLNAKGVIDLAKYTALLDKHTRLVAICHSSNVIGVNNPVEQICKIARNKNIVTVIDGAQSIVRCDVNVNSLDCDIYTFSAHKLYGPTGCGVAYIRADLLEVMRPYQVGGAASISQHINEDLEQRNPQKLELNTVNIVGIVGLVEAIDYLTDMSSQKLNDYLCNLSAYMHERLNLLPYFQPLFPIQPKQIINHSIACFQLNGLNSQDVAGLLDYEGIAVSVGHHCAQSLHRLLGVDSSVRVSLGIYNDYKDVDHLVSALESAYRVMAV